MTIKTIIITGAANGIGQALTIRCLQAGHHVWACDIDAKGLALLKERHVYESLSIFPLDISDYSQVGRFFNELTTRQAQPTCLVNNAGIYLGKNVLDYSAEEMQHVLHVNCLGALYFSQLFAKPLISAKQTGVIVNISSVSGEEGSSDAVYGLTKAALLGLTKSCAMNFAPYIRVNAIAPGLVSTPLIQRIPPARLEEYRSTELLKSPILPEDVADTLAFLINDQTKHYTGAIFDLNNGCYRR